MGEVLAGAGVSLMVYSRCDVNLSLDPKIHCFRVKMKVVSRVLDDVRVGMTARSARTKFSSESLQLWLRCFYPLPFFTSPILTKCHRGIS